MRISVVGLGKLGAPMAAVMASKGHTVIGVDVNPAFVEAINRGHAPVQEPQLQEKLDAGRARISATLDVGKAVRDTDITFVIVPTPSTAAGDFSLRYALDAMASIGRALREKAAYHVVVMTSTVMPGATDRELVPALERASGKSVGAGFGFCYSPEFIALGSVIRDMLHPDMILIGESDARAGDAVESIYRSTVDNSPAYARMNFVNAELTKISVNTFVTTKIAYANMLADICDRLPHADVDVVTGAVGADSRIGKKYLRGALAYGGPCFPRDNRAFAYLAETVGARADLAKATDGLNAYQTERLVQLIRNRAGAGRRIAILGLSYKPHTAVIEESASIHLAARLAKDGLVVAVHDPLALDAARAVLQDSVTYCASAADAAESADVVVIATAWPDYARLDAGVFAKGARKAVFDCWRTLPIEVGSVCDVFYLGTGGGAAASAKRVAQ